MKFNAAPYLSILALAGSSMAFSPSAWAVTNSTFLTTATGAVSWNVATNWNTNPLIPGVSGNTDDTALFSALAGGLNPLSLDTLITIKSITNTTGNRGLFVTNGTGGSLVFATTNGVIPSINLSPSVNGTVLFQFGTAAVVGPPAVAAGALTTDISQGLAINVTGTGANAATATTTGAVRIQSAATFTGTGTVTMTGGVLAPQAANVLPKNNDIVLNASQLAVLGSTNGVQNVRGLDGNTASSVANFTNTSTAVLTLGNANTLASDSYNFAGAIGANTAAATPVAGANISVVKAGAGTQILSGANTYTGATTVNAGTLVVNGTHTGGGAYSVTGGSTLGGIGTINSTGVTVGNGTTGGIITGATNGAIATLTINTPTFTLNGTAGNSASVVVDISGATADTLALSGQLVLAGTSDHLTFQMGASPLTASSYDLITYTGTTVTSGFVVDNLPANYALNYGAGVISLTAVPEPSSWAFAFTGSVLFGVAMFHRRSGAVIG